MGRYMTVEAVELAHQKQHAMQVCMEKAKPDDLKIFLQFYTESVSCIQIAEALGKTANAVRLRLSRIRAAIRKCVERQLAAGS